MHLRNSSVTQDKSGIFLRTNCLWESVKFRVHCAL
jgi:hypothetical protein